MNEIECGLAAYKLIKNGELLKAIALCESEPYSASVHCQGYLGWIYFEQREMENALFWYRKAADQGSAEALFAIGQIHTLRKEYLISIPFFERAAANGYQRGYQYLGEIYEKGYGVPIDINKAIHYYKNGKNLGYVAAERKLIQLESIHGSFLTKIVSRIKIIRLGLRAWDISRRNMDDPRLADVPNFSSKRSRRCSIPLQKNA